MAEHEKYYIRIPETLVEVSKDVYSAYYQEKRHSRTLAEKDQRNGVVSYDGMDTLELSGLEMIPDRDAVSVEDAAIANLQRDELYRCLSMLPQQERKTLLALYFEDTSEREYAEILGISQNAVNKRRRKALAALRRLMKT